MRTAPTTKSTKTPDRNPDATVVAPEAPTLDELEGAFRTLVDTLVTHRAALEPSQPRGWQMFNLMTTPDIVLKARDIVGDPVSYALKRGIKTLGQTIYDLHGMDVLGEVAERVCAKGVGDFQCRMSPVDSALNGVGRGNNRWWS